MFFPAEDGVRGAVGNRGLGEVYKRQKRFWTVARANVHVYQCSCTVPPPNVNGARAESERFPRQI